MPQGPWSLPSLNPWLPFPGLECLFLFPNSRPSSLLPASQASPELPKSFLISRPLHVFIRPDSLVTVLRMGPNPYLSLPVSKLAVGWTLGLGPAHPTSKSPQLPAQSWISSLRGMTKPPLQNRLHGRADMPCRGQRRREPMLHCLPSGSSLWGEGARRHHGSLPSHDVAVHRLSLSPSEPHGPPAAPQRAFQVCQCLCW